MVKKLRLKTNKELKSTFGIDKAEKLSKKTYRQSAPGFNEAFNDPDVNKAVKRAANKTSKVIKKTKSEFTNRNAFVEIDTDIYAINEKGVIKKSSTNNWINVLRFSWTPLNFIVYDIKIEKAGVLLVATSDGMYKYNLGKKTFATALQRGMLTHQLFLSS